MSVFWYIVIITAIAGVFGTGLGGVVGALFKKESSKTISLLLSFAGGVMMAVVCFDLMPGALRPEGALENIPLWIVVAGILVGYGTIYLFNNIIDKTTNPEVAHIDHSHPKTADDIDELTHANHLNEHIKTKGNPTELLVAGIVMACAIALHNMPEGMVIGATYAAQTGSQYNASGIIIAIVIGLHNIPEGMAVAVPLITGGMSKWKAVLVTALSGAPTIIGAIIGYSLGMLSPIWLALALSFASGAMFYVVFGELLPEAFLMWKSKAPGAFALIGTLVGFILVYV